MKVLVTGGRGFKDAELLRATLARLDSQVQFTELIHGGAQGADALAQEWALEQEIPIKMFLADWEKYGKAAGPIRNQQMLVEGKPDLVVAFQGGRGTASMVSRAQQAEAPVVEVA
jgi:hypothetical protein